MPKRILDAPSGPEPLGPYSIATEANGFVFLSGMVGIDPATGRSAGNGVEDQTHQTMRNIGAILGDLGLGYADIVKVTIFVTDMADFSQVNAVYGEYVGGSKPARSTVEVSALPGGFRVEMEAVAAR